MVKHQLTFSMAVIKLPPCCAHLHLLYSCVSLTALEKGERMKGRGEVRAGTGGKGQEGRSTYLPEIWTLRLESSKELRRRSSGFARLQARPCPALNQCVKMTFFDEMQLRTVCCRQGGALECSVNVNGKARGKLLCVQVRCQIGPSVLLGLFFREPQPRTAWERAGTH